MSKYNNELPIIQKTYDLIVWYVPLLNKLPRDHKFNLGDRIAKGLYDLLISKFQNYIRYFHLQRGLLVNFNALCLDFKYVKLNRDDT